MARLPAAPLEVGVTPHWLAINGVQPATVENAQPRRTAAPARGAAAPSPRPAAAQRQPQAGAAAEQQGEAAGGIVASLPLKHSMPEELHLYYDVVRRALQAKGGAHGCGPLPGHAVAASLATDPGVCECCRLGNSVARMAQVCASAAGWATQLLGWGQACAGPQDAQPPQLPLAPASRVLGINSSFSHS